MIAAAAASGPSAYWYLTRGTGVIALILLTVSVALGVADVRRMRTATMPRFVVDAVHRNASLLAVAFLFVHIVTSLLDSFAPIKLIDAIVPFASAYRPLWLGLGTIASDLMIAVALTSVLRRRLGYGAWRATHWLAYASWPVAVIHGLGTGSDVKTSWMLVITGVCVIVVIVAVVARVTDGWPAHAGARATALVASALVPIGLLAWLPSGPLAAGWAKRAGTPSSLLVSSAASGGGGSAAAGGSGSAGSSAASTSFTAQASGTVRQGQTADGSDEVDISLALAGQQLSALDIRIVGQAINGGGISMTSSQATLGTASNTSKYRGTITALNGTNIHATLSGGGSTINLVAQLQLASGGGSATGTVTTTTTKSR
jgi:Ferric reductase like transmembrane component